MAERTIKLTGDLEAFVDAQVESGAYATPEDVVRAGLEALKGTSSAEAADIASGTPLSAVQIRELVAEADADFAAGRLHRYDRAGDLAEDIKREGRRLFRERQGAPAKQTISRSPTKHAATSQKSTTGSRRTKT